MLNHQNKYYQQLSAIFIVMSILKQSLNIQGPILIVLTTRSYALTSDATGVANAVWPLKTAKLHLPH